MRKTYHFLFSCVLAAMIGILPILAFSQDEGADSTKTHKEKSNNLTSISSSMRMPEPCSITLIFLLTSGLHRLTAGVSVLAACLAGNSIPSGVSGGKITAGKLYGERATEWWLPYEKVFYKANIFDYHLDLTINFSNLISGYNPDRFLDVYGILVVARFNGRQKRLTLPLEMKYARTATALTRFPAAMVPRMVLVTDTLTLEGVTGLGLAMHISPEFEINAGI